MRIIVIGGVAAGATTATKLKRLNFNDEVIMIERGNYVSFANCGLPYFISGDISSKEKLIVQKPSYFQDRYGIDVRINTNVNSINREKQTLITEKNGIIEELSYDKLVIATGGSPINPTLEGVDKSHVFKLWTIPDMEKIDDFIKENKPKNAVVIGGGFIGLEMVEALVHRGLKVSLIEKSKHIMPNIDFEYAKMISQILEKNGVSIHENVGLKTINDQNILLENNTNIDADMVILSIGVSPNNELAKNSEIKIGVTGGILVDEKLQTNDQNIYACGDVIELERKIDNKKVRIPLAGPASKQGRIVAKNINGKNEKYNGTTGASVIKIFDHSLAFVGLSKELSMEFSSKMASFHKVIHPSYYPNAYNLSMSLIYNKNGNILGAVAFGKKDVEKRIDIISTAIYSKLKVTDLVEMDFAYSPPFNNPNDHVNYLGMICENDLNNTSPLIHFNDIDLDNGIVLDVRENSERKEQGFVKNSIHIPLLDIENRINEIPKDKNIYIHCQSGMRSYIILRKLLNNGYNINKLYNITGGFMSIKYSEKYLLS